MKMPQAGSEIDGFVIGARVHSGSMALIYQVAYAGGRASSFDMVMKVPRMTEGDGAETIVGFEVEHQIMQLLSGPHVPRLVAAGDMATLPYLVMEYVPGRTLNHWLELSTPGHRPDAAELARLGAAVAHATHSLHQQDTVHLDIKPANVIIRDDGSAVLLDFGLSVHAHSPDLLAEELRKAVGSPAYMAPEQVVGVRGDPRSDIFAIGVMLYELATGELPFGSPSTQAGLRQRLWMDPPPLRQLRPELPQWLQEVVMRCLACAAEQRYPSAAHLAFDLTHCDQIQVTARGRALRGPGFMTHFRRWIRAAGLHYQPSPLPTRQIEQVPIIMVAVPNQDVSDATLYSLRQAVARSLGIRPGARLACVTVIAPGAGSTSDQDRSETGVHRHLLAMLQQWTRGLPLDEHQTSFHVLESGDVAQALLRYARGNHVSMIVMGAATHGVQLQRLVAPVPIKVAMEAPCTVVLVKQGLPFEQLASAAANGPPSG